tara:strand:- start:1605 stop:2231 length:627 start_codon:yes stop_codon:yes gene_type:complete
MIVSRNDIPEFLTSCNLVGSGAEIGTFQGEYAKIILDRWPGTLYMVDPWRPLGEEYQDASNQKDHLDAYSTTMQNINGHEERAHMIRALSHQAVKLFADNSLDFVYIDGSHAYDYVKEDIRLWYPKVKKGGLVAGHDYLDIDWDNDPNFLENGKDKHIWFNPPPGSEEEASYGGVFGVNPAVDEFVRDTHYNLSVTKEWTGTWYFIKS